jgi:hypothetical protein
MANENLIGTSTDGAVPAVKGENTGGGGFGVLGICATGHGVHGQSITSKGVVGESEGFHGVFGKSRDNVGVAAESQNTEAMNALSHSVKHAAIIAINDAGGPGVQARSGPNVGVAGESDTGRGVHGTSNTNIGVSGDSQLSAGVRGTSVRGRGTEGLSTNLEGVVGISKQSTGVLGISEASGTGVIGQSNTGIGVHGKGGRLAGLFEGRVEVTESLTVRGFDVIALIEALGRTNFGEPIQKPPTRPNLAVRQLRREELAVDEPAEARHFEVQGSGFLRGTPVVIRFFNTTSLDLNDFESPNIPPRHSVVSDPNGAISLRAEQIRCRPGDHLQVAASDGRGDSNDLSSTLWSNSVPVAVS